MPLLSGGVPDLPQSSREPIDAYSARSRISTPDKIPAATERVRRQTSLMTAMTFGNRSQYQMAISGVARHHVLGARTDRSAADFPEPSLTALGD